METVEGERYIGNQIFTLLQIAITKMCIVFTKDGLLVGGDYSGCSSGRCIAGIDGISLFLFGGLIIGQRLNGLPSTGLSFCKRQGGGPVPKGVTAIYDICDAGNKCVDIPVSKQ